jgi:hypothetical protein
VLNEGRTKTGPENRFSTGPHFDSIIKEADVTHDFEYCIIEAKPRSTGETTTEFILDYDKLLKGLSPMLSRLVQSVRTSDVKRVEVFGLMLAGISSPLLDT